MRGFFVFNPSVSVQIAIGNNENALTTLRQLFDYA